MYFKLLLGLAVLTSATTSKLPSENDEQTAQSCSQNIPEDRSVELGGECRSTGNCQRSDVSTECVSVRDNYCECKAVDGEVEDRMGKGKKWKKKGKKGKRKWRKKPLCKKFKGHSCSRRSKCKRRYERRDKRCKHVKRYVCCVKCRKQEYHRCVTMMDCPASQRATQYQCGRKTHVCCSARKYGETCSEDKQCIGDKQGCNPNSGTCDCRNGAVHDGSGNCECAAPDGSGGCFACDAGWKQFKHRCYKEGSTAANNDDAKDYCKGLRADATLGVISTSEESDFIEANFDPVGRWWIGLFDASKSTSQVRDWQWPDGTPVTFTAWFTTDPNNSNSVEHCVIGEGGLNAWSDVPCTLERVPLCSYKK